MANQMVIEARARRGITPCWENVVILKIDHARELEFISYSDGVLAAEIYGFPVRTVIHGSISDSFKIGVIISREVQLTGRAKL